MRKKKVSTQHEKYIGERIREARIALGMSQHALASMIGISYQQLQKYENGSNRVSGARIQIMATALNRPLEFFFANVTDVRTSPAISQAIATKKGQRLIQLWSIMQPRRQDALLTVAVEFTEETADG